MIASHSQLSCSWEPNEIKRKRESTILFYDPETQTPIIVMVFGRLPGFAVALCRPADNRKLWENTHQKCWSMIPSIQKIRQLKQKEAQIRGKLDKAVVI
jgi:hypothetical protein